MLCNKAAKYISSKFTLVCFGSGFNNLSLKFSVGRLTKAAKRLYSDAYPKITTHYTIHPRDKDPRWKGKR